MNDTISASCSIAPDSRKSERTGRLSPPRCSTERLNCERAITGTFNSLPRQLLKERLEEGADEDYLVRELARTVRHWSKVFDDIVDLHKFINYFNKCVSEMELPVADKTKFFIVLED